MPMNDYLTLLLINMSAGLFVLAAFFYWGLASPNVRMWAPGLAMPGAIALIAGLHMVFAWPFHGPASFANVAFGEMSVLLGIIFLGAALSVAFAWPLNAVAIYAAVAALAAIVVGARIMNAGLTASPPMTGAGFLLTGIVGLLALPVVGNPTRTMRLYLALLTSLAAALWTFVALTGYWAHVAAAAQLTR